MREGLGDRPEVSEHSLGEAQSEEVREGLANRIKVMEHGLSETQSE